MGVIAERLQEIQQKIVEACSHCSREPNTVKLIAVSKTFPVQAILEAYEAGQRDFGENYPQELREKQLALNHISDIRWHFLGRIQSNKARWLIPGCFRIHSLDSAEHAATLARYGTVEGLLLVNIGCEPQKSGIMPEHALAVAAQIAALPQVQLRGFMALPPVDQDPKPFFQELSDLARAGRNLGLVLNELSMGMSEDFPTAIHYGATWIRVGTAIFGERSLKR